VEALRLMGHGLRLSLLCHGARRAGGGRSGGGHGAKFFAGQPATGAAAQAPGWQTRREAKQVYYALAALRLDDVAAAIRLLTGGAGAAPLVAPQAAVAVAAAPAAAPRPPISARRCLRRLPSADRDYIIANCRNDAARLSARAHPRDAARHQPTGGNDKMKPAAEATRMSRPPVKPALSATVIRMPMIVVAIIANNTAVRRSDITHPFPSQVGGGCVLPQAAAQTLILRKHRIIFAI
jgi:hypothetical protein